MKKKLLLLPLILTALASTSYGSPQPAQSSREFKFKFLDLSQQKILLEKSVSASSSEEALEKVALLCFSELRSQNISGLDAIDICVNPRI